jgi:hypothetical protein
VAPNIAIVVDVAVYKLYGYRGLKIFTSLKLTFPGFSAEEGFIYGLPIVMNYAVMSEFTLDKDSYNRIYNDSQVFTYKDTTIVTPNSDTPYSMLWLDLRAEPMVVSVPAVPKERYYSVQFVDGNVYNYGYVGTSSAISLISASSSIFAGSEVAESSSWARSAWASSVPGKL